MGASRGGEATVHRHLMGTALIVFAWVTAFSVFVQAAKAGPYEEGQAAYNRGDLAAAYKLLRPLAEQGDASAQSRLGDMYRTGGEGGVGRDFREAVKWYRKAAEK